VRFNAVQWAWVDATFAFIVLVFLDIADVVAVPNAVLILGGLLLALVSRLVGPSVAELERANRRG
jgi:hypothetical protein